MKLFIAIFTVWSAYAFIPSLQIQEANATTCFATGSKTAGMNKICFYDCLGSEYAITVGAAELCPLTINR